MNLSTFLIIQWLLIPKCGWLSVYIVILSACLKNSNSCYDDHWYFITLLIKKTFVNMPATVAICIYQKWFKKKGELTNLQKINHFKHRNYRGSPRVFVVAWFIYVINIIVVSSLNWKNILTIYENYLVFEIIISNFCQENIDQS